MQARYPRCLSVAIAALSFILVSGPLGAEVGQDPYAHFFDDTFGDFREELETAREQEKVGVLIFF